MANPVFWDVKLLDCCDAAPVCVLACLCPGVVQSVTFFKLKKYVLPHCLLAQLCCCIGMAFNRQKIRKNEKIDGDYWMECLLYACVCFCCHTYLATQEYRQISLNY